MRGWVSIDLHNKTDNNKSRTTYDGEQPKPDSTSFATYPKKKEKGTNVHVRPPVEQKQERAHQTG